MGKGKPRPRNSFLERRSKAMDKYVRLKKELAKPITSSQGVTWIRYLGTLHRFNTSPLVKRAYSNYRNILMRCNKEWHKDYEFYGAKGIKLEIDVRDFIGWWIAHFGLKNWVLPTVSRVDHSRGYFFDNIVMEEMSDNSKERMFRAGNPISKRPIYLLDSQNRPVKRYESARAAARELGLSLNAPSESARRKNWTKKTRYRFAWADEFNL